MIQVELYPKAFVELQNDGSLIFRWPEKSPTNRIRYRAALIREVQERVLNFISGDEWGEGGQDPRPRETMMRKLAEKYQGKVLVIKGEPKPKAGMLY